MRFEVKLPGKMAVWVLRCAGVGTDEYVGRHLDVLEEKASYPIEVSCPYTFSEAPAKIRLKVFAHDRALFHAALDVDDEMIGRRIQEKVVRYSIENNGEALEEQEH